MSDAHSAPNGNITVHALFVELGLAVAALVVGYLLNFAPLQSIPTDPRHLAENVPALLWGLAATLPMLGMLMVIERSQSGPLKRLGETADRLLIPLFARTTVFELALISLAAGLGEELLFRGLLQALLAERLSLPYATACALGIASLIFGLCHWITPTYALLATLIGFYLGGLFLWTGNLLAPIVTHGLYDFLALVYLVKWRRPDVEAEWRDPNDDDDFANPVDEIDQESDRA